MKAVISSTYDDKYIFFLPITTWLWNKLGVDVICFAPIERSSADYARLKLVLDFCNNYGLSVHQFTCPEHKEATYAQCSRLFAGSLDLPDNEVVVTSDIDMGVFSKELFDDFNPDSFPSHDSIIIYFNRFTS